ncbi:MAG: DUF1330 domain-containing protein [Paracoccus sp. (in: a-proteobacteria)]|nr:DUF1330 domain-containing protein [Paracoccus sp. (in: a-proteobacteria)]
MSALWIAHVTITDPAGFKEYARRAAPVIEAHGGEYLTRGGVSIHLEGTERERHVVIRFPTLDDARACYESEDYREAMGYAEGASTRDLVIVEENGRGA